MEAISGDFEIVDILDGEHLGWQLENTLLSASVMELQVRVASGLSRPCWQVTHLGPRGNTLSQEIVWSKQPRIDIPSHKLQ